MTKFYAAALALLLPAGLLAQPVSEVKHPEWAGKASVYEVNLRQFTGEGTINAFRPHLKRLDDLGADILWFMPVNPIGKENRKGSLGSYYSISNYTAINPEYGTMDDFKAMVKEAHALGMKVIIDWVANHSAWDHAWAKDHPDWYQKDSTGKFLSPWDWTDVIALDYKNPKMRKAMLEEMKFWVKECDIDGFRCDVAFLVPQDFWENARKELDKIKPVYMLAESEERAHHNKAFDATYSWELMHLMNEVAAGKKELTVFREYLAKQDTTFAPTAYRLSFVTNHDENSWNGTEFERYGANATNYMIMAYTFQGQPLVYSGQEVALNRRLPFFEKDSIDWNNLKQNALIRRLLQLSESEAALHPGIRENRAQIIGDENKLLMYKRVLGNSEVLVILNFSAEDQRIILPENGYYQNVLDEKMLRVWTKTTHLLPAHGALVLKKLN